MLPIKLPLMRGSVVEILASKGRLRYIVTNPPNGMEMTWHNTITVPKPYKGPLEFHFEQVRCGPLLALLAVNPNTLVLCCRAAASHARMRAPHTYRTHACSGLQDLPPDQPVKLAVTCWARAAFEVLHTRTAAGAHGLNGRGGGHAGSCGRADGSADGGAPAGASSPGGGGVDLDDVGQGGAGALGLQE
jgi:hypothetical protein